MSEFGKKNELLSRVYMVLLLFILSAIAIVWRMVDISIINGDYWTDKREKRYMEWRTVPTLRGNIYADDSQSLLATSVEFFEIRMDPVAQIRDEDFNAHINDLCRSLADYPGGKSAAEWKNMIAGARSSYKSGKKRGTRNLLIAKNVDHFGLMKLKSYPLFELGQMRGGMIKLKDYRRRKPFDQLAERTIGEYRDVKMVGLENRFDKLLKGEEKKAYMQKLPGGLYVPVYDPTDYEIIKGRDIVTTINVALQDIVHNELRKGMMEHNAEGAVAILMEVETGRVKAISNLSTNSKGKIGEFHNMAFVDRSEPGSTMKAASVLALLEDNLASSETIVDFSYGKKKFWDQWMYDSGNHGMSKGTLQQAFEKSSNVGIASIMQEKYGSKEDRKLYYDKLMQFGFGTISGLELEGEPKPFIKDPVKNKKEWYGTTVPWMAHGYELSMTPLQMLNFYNAIANDGRLMQPQLVKAISYNDKVEKEFKPIVKKEKIASKENIEVLQKMLDGVVVRGTGKSLQSEYYNFSGKTGTTVVGYGTDDEKYNASFVGYWPSEKPRYSMMVMVYGLKGAKYYGNVVAGPIFKRIMDWTFAIEEGAVAIEEGGTPETDFDGEAYDGEVYGYGQDFDKIFSDLEINFQKAGRWIKGGNSPTGDVVSQKAKISINHVPDLAGMGLRDAVYVLENLGMDVKVEGSGKVYKQSLNPGKIIDNQAIILYLN